MAAASTSPIFSPTLDHFLKNEDENDEIYEELKLRKEIRELGEEKELGGRCECCGRKTKNLRARKMYDPQSGTWVTLLVGPECARHPPRKGWCRRQAALARWEQERKKREAFEARFLEVKA